MFEELHMPITKPIPLYSNNNGAIFISNNPVQERRMKHIDVKYHYIRQVIEDCSIQVERVDTDDNIADIFTKPLGRIKFNKFKNQLGLEFYSSRVQ